MNWDEVDSCVVSYDMLHTNDRFFINMSYEIILNFQQTFGHFFKDLNLHTQDDFNEFDVNQDGKLTYAEWYEKYQNL